MPAYWCARVHVTDPETYAKYAALAGPAIEKHRGVFLARGGNQMILEGGNYERSVVARFPTLEDAVKCYNSPEYTEARKHTIGTSERHMVAVDGIE
ncbi:hypothetical protein AYJ54_32975 [Bradyrhizobium centrolobii]|uniref:DUF1330 domain-containing protein n=1 Tax=Bradyrhizobium centrolobii TaxID=1505087 RepID=A0A176YA82_9BRAD|nr:DUF1330 domain-containing protein [Bradyrhizobium centrolobii]OAE99693.1 hypothetical protein AYJ54_32975 [Bradyrhizobium centrolobii]